jgi:hypothetical protein
VKSQSPTRPKRAERRCEYCGKQIDAARSDFSDEEHAAATTRVRRTIAENRYQLAPPSPL